MGPSNEHDQHLADLLVKHRARPDDAVVERIERRVLGKATRSAASRPRRRLAVALGGGICAVALGAMLLTGSPLDPDPSVQAEPSCREVLVQERKLRPTVITGPDGTPRIEQRPGIVTRTVTRCR